MNRKKTAAKQRRHGSANLLGNTFKDKPERINRKGRPKKLPELELIISKVLTEQNRGVDRATAIIRALVRKAVRGDLKAAEMILNRAYGKPKDTLQVDAGFAELPLFSESVLELEKQMLSLKTSSPQ